MDTYSVYKHTNKYNNKIYIGITKQNPIKRWANGKGYKINSHFRNAIEKYGWDNFTHEILFNELSKEEACKLETKLILKYNSIDAKHGYNNTTGGESGYECSIHTRNKISEFSKKRVGCLNPFFGHTHSQETKNTISESRKGKALSEETKLKISNSLIGDKSYWYNKKFSESHRNNLSKSHIGVNHPKSKEVFRYSKNGEFIDSFVNAYEANRILGINKNSINEVCNSKRKTAGGFIWSYEDLEQKKKIEKKLKSTNK